MKKYTAVLFCAVCALAMTLLLSGCLPAFLMVQSVPDEALEKEMEEKWEDAFRDAHNLKGISVNLGLQNLFESSTELCESMRNGKPAVDIQPMFDRVKQDYETVVAAIAQL